MKEKIIPESIEKRCSSLERINYKDIDKSFLILDTNFLFIPFEFKIDIISESRRVLGTTHSLAILSSSIHELGNIEKKKTKNKKFLSLVATLLERYGVKVIKVQETYADDILVKCSEQGAVIATNDKELKKRIVNVRGKLLYMRNSRYLESS